MAKRRIARRVGFEKCLIPCKELKTNFEINGRCTHVTMMMITIIIYLLCGMLETLLLKSQNYNINKKNTKIEIK